MRTTRGHVAMATVLITAAIVVMACQPAPGGKIGAAAGTPVPPITTTPADKDALIAEIARIILDDPEVEAAEWDRFALVVYYGDRFVTMNGFTYVGDAPGRPEIADLAVDDQVDELRAATRVDGQEPWRACILKLVKARVSVEVQFAYGDDAEAWRVTPVTAADVARRARP